MQKTLEKEQQEILEGGKELYKKIIEKLIKELVELNKGLSLEELFGLLNDEVNELRISKKRMEKSGLLSFLFRMRESVNLEEADCIILSLQLLERDFEWFTKKRVEQEVNDLLFKYDTDTLSKVQLVSIIYKAERTIARLKGGYYDVR